MEPLLPRASANRSVRFFDAVSGNAKKLGQHKDVVRDLAFSPDGKTLATASYDHTIRLWDINRDEFRVLRGHSAAVNGIAFSPDGSLLASLSDDGTIRVWNPDQRVITDSASLATELDPTTSAEIGEGDAPRTPR